MLVGGVVVGDQMDRKPGRHIAVEVIKKGAKFLVPMARLALSDDRAVEHVERREQRSSLVIRNVKVHGHRTSVRLEPQMCHSMIEICRREFCTTHCCNY